MKTLTFLTLSLTSLHLWAAESPATCQEKLRSGEYDQASLAAEQVLKRDANDRDALLCLGRAKGMAGDHPAAVVALKASEQQSSNPVARMQSLTLLGHEYKRAQEYGEARAAYQQSLQLAQTEKNKYFQRANLIGIGETREQAKELDAALEVYQQAMKLAANDNERADCHAHLASAYHAMKNHEQAVIHQLKAAVMEERSGDLDHYAQAHLDLGRYYADAAMTNDAERVLNKLLEVVKSADDAYWQAATLHQLGRVKLARGLKEEGSAQLQQAVDLARKIGATELVSDIEGSLNM